MAKLNFGFDRFRMLALGFALALVAILPLEGTTGLRYFLLMGALLFSLIHYFSNKGAWKSFRFPIWQFWGGYGVLACIGLIWAIDVNYSIDEIRKEIFIGILFFILGVNLFNDDRGWEALLKVCVVSYLAQTIYCLVIWSVGGSTTPKGMLGTWNTGPGGFSTYLVTIFPLLMLCVVLYAKSATGVLKYVLVIISLHMLALFATDNRQGLIVVVLEMLLLSVMLVRPLGRFKVGLILFVLIIAAAMAFSQKMVVRSGAEPGVDVLNVSKALNKDGRLPTWRFVLKDVLSDPWKGSGFGRNTFSHRYAGEPILESFPHAHAHNFIIDRLIQLGIPGAVAFLFLFWSVPVNLYRRRFVASGSWNLMVAGFALCIGVFFKNMTDDFFFREYGYLFWIITGAMLGRQYHEACKASASRPEVVR